MATQSSSATKVMINRQTVFDLTAWLNPLAVPSEQQQQRMLNEQSQLLIFYLANQFWLMGALVHRLKQHSIWYQFDRVVTDYLLQLDSFYIERAQAIRQETIHVCELLKKNAIDAVVLKGAASLFNGVSTPYSIRFMSDIDILVPTEQQLYAVSLLKHAGYSEDDVDHKIDATGHYHSAPLRRPDGICYIEIHRAAQKNTLQDLLPTNDIWQRAIPLKLNDELDVFQLSVEDQIVLSIAHSEIADRGFRDRLIELRQLFDLLNLIHTFSDQINWCTIEQRFSDANQLPAYYARLDSSNKLFESEFMIPQLNKTACDKHFAKCIHNLISPSDDEGRLLSIFKIFKGYSRENMDNLYGCSNQFELLNARLKHLSRHLKKSIRIQDKERSQRK